MDSFNARGKAVRVLASILALSFGFGASPVHAVDTNTKAQADVEKSTDSPDDASMSKIRLSRVAEPTAYEIQVKPDIESGTFKGAESISVHVNKPTDHIDLNAAELHVNFSFFQASPTQQFGTTVTMDPDNERVTVSFGQTVQPGDYKLFLGYDGILNDKLHGFYRSNFTDSAGKKHWLATTQMEAIDARRMFVCFDQPEFKATFDLSAVIKPGQVAISNSPIKSQTPDKDDPSCMNVKFDTTPKMSTYLLALVVGELVPSKTVVSAGVPIRVWSTPGHEKLTGYALDVAAKLLPFYNSYFGVDYPAKKLDLIAIPDFSAGAMENLGAITFREKYLLMDEKEGSTDTKQGIADTVAHEMAHMWFGDLVTMKWWDDLWLNEAFATWMATKAVNQYRPDWNSWDRFSQDRLGSMNTDCLLSTRPIHFTVSNPSQVEQMFDEITYGKGASVLRMLEKYVGEDVFRDGVQRYIKAHQFSNASTDDLWTGISEASHQNINELMHNWIYEPGYPLISLSNEAGEVRVAQKRFFHLNKEVPASAVWQVPLTYRSWQDDSSPIQPFLFKEAKDTLPSSNESLVVNAGGNGYYRVAYPTPMLQSIGKHAAQLTVNERVALLSDQFNLALAGETCINDYLNLTENFKDDQDPTVISTMTKQFDELAMLVNPDSREALGSFICDRLAKAKRHAGGWKATPNESDLAKMLRNEVLLCLGTIGGDRSTVVEARELFAKYIENANSVDPELVETVLKIVAFNGDSSDYTKLISLFKSAKTPETEQSALEALAQFQNPAIVDSILKMCLTDEIRTQDAPQVIKHVGETVGGRKPAFEFLKANWETINKRFAKHQLPRMLSGTGCLATGEDLQSFRIFFAEHQTPEVSRSIDKMEETIEVNVAFRDHSGNTLSSWLAENQEVEKKNLHAFAQ